MENINLITGGRYLVLEQIGAGGYSEVYKVRDVNSGRIFAMKRYITSDPENRKQLIDDIERELSVLKYVSHPVLPSIYNIIKENDKFFLIMEYVEGTNLKKVVEKDGILSWKQLLNIMEQVCSGLYYLHSLQPPIIYRDLKPSNIILRKDGTVKLIDFGIAKRYNREIFSDTKAYGTKGYAAPEQFGNTDGTGIYNTDIRSDIFGIGTTMHYLMTGKSYDYSGKIKSIYVSSKLKKIILKCVSIKPKDRYPNCILVLTKLYTYKEPLFYKIMYPIFRLFSKYH